VFKDGRSNAPERLRGRTIHIVELDPAVDDSRRCKKNSLSVLSSTDKKTKDGFDRGRKISTVHIGEA